MRNGILTTVVLMFMKTWGQYLWPSLVTGQKIKPISVTISNMLSPNFWVDPRVKIAAMLIAMFPPLLIYLIFQRYVIEGITMSGVKGLVPCSKTNDFQEEKNMNEYVVSREDLRKWCSVP